MSSNRSSRSRLSRPTRKEIIEEKLAQARERLASRTTLIALVVTLCCVGVLSASLNLNWRTWQPSAGEQVAVAPLWPPPSLLPAAHSRKVFPYSVIAGGAESAEELKAAAAMDPVVARHYADFDMGRARRVTLDTPRLVYVSYRIGNKVFWTKNKLTLPKGEAMLSDGRNMARTRCGNRVSVEPVRPNAPADPSMTDLDAPVIPAMTSTPYLAAYTAGPPEMFGAPIPSGGGGPFSSMVPVAPFFPMPGGGGIIGSEGSTTPVPGGGGGGTPGSGGGGTPGSGGAGGGTPGGGGPPVGVPEPGTAALVLIGLGVAAMGRRRARKA